MHKNNRRHHWCLQQATSICILMALAFTPISDANAGPFEDEYNAASVALSVGRLAEAQQKFESALKIAPPSQVMMVRWFLASTYAAQQKPDKAITEYLALLNDPQVPKGFKESIVIPLSMSYDSVGKPEKAIEILSATLAGGVTSSLKDLMTLELGTDYIYEKRYVEARQTLEKSLASKEVSDNYAPSFSLRIGTTYLLEGNFDAAIERYQELLSRPALGDSTTQQMVSAQSKQAARLELAQARIGQALEQQREILKSKFLSPEVEALARENAQQLEQLQAKFTTQFVVVPPQEAVAVKTSVATEGEHDGHIKLGFPAPDFTLIDANGKTQTLSDYRGKKKVLLTFFPKCFTGGCISHLSSLRDHITEFEAQDVQILAVSVDSADGPKGQVAFAKQWDLPFPLLPDTDRKLCMLYGAAQKPDDLASRMSVLIDAQGIVQIIDKQVHVATHGLDLLNHMKLKPSVAE